MAVDTLEEYQRKYQEALDRVTQSLDARKNRLFDPTLLAMAEGFLAPTRTGSFGESLGIAAGKLRGAEEAEFKREQELAQAQLGLAQQGMQLEQQRARQRFLAGMMPGAAPSGAPPQPGAQPPGQPTVPPGAQPATPMGTPAGAAQPLGQPGAAQLPAGSQAAVAQQPPGTEGIKGEPFMPPNPNIANRVNFLRAAMMDPSKGVLDLAKELEDLERKRYMETPEGMVDLAAGLIYRTKKPDIAPVAVQLRTIPGLEGQTIDVSTPIARDLNDALNEAMRGNPARLRQLEADLVKSYAEQPAAPSQGAPSGPGRVMTRAEAEAKASAQKEKAGIRAKGEATRTEDAFNSGRAASDSIPDLMQLKTLATGPTSDRILGPLTTPSVLNQLVVLAESGVGMSGFNVGVPAIRQAALNMRLSPEEMRDYQLVGQLLVKMQLGIPASERGPGSMSNFERELIASSKITRDDTPATVRTKVEGMLLSAKYREQIADRLNETGLDYDAFIRSAEGKKLMNDYREAASNLISRLPAPRASSRSPAKPDVSAARREADKLTGRQ
jgi:hypothetical protein